MHENSGLESYEPWDETTAQTIFAKAPFQKTEYKSPLAIHPPKGSIAEYLMRK